jgi:hypothetical protein
MIERFHYTDHVAVIINSFETISPAYEMEAISGDDRNASSLLFRWMTSARPEEVTTSSC